MSISILSFFFLPFLRPEPPCPILSHFLFMPCPVPCRHPSTEVTFVSSQPGAGRTKSQDITELGWSRVKSILSGDKQHPLNTPHPPVLQVFPCSPDLHHQTPEPHYPMKETATAKLNLQDRDMYLPQVTDLKAMGEN